ncbi:amidohydrolase [Tsukamurella soli]|uniref:Amidohydrolase n=1 Tax=Tsukamurella soli TaxID=644556 RepID=A0ABP8J3P6_9ACTN
MSDSRSATSSSADVVLLGGVIDTLADGIGRTDALALRDGRVVAHGAAARALADGADTVDLRGAYVMPGLIDAHNHHWLAGQTELYEFEIPPTAPLDEVLEAVSTRAASAAPGAWLVGGSWGSGLLGELDSAATLARLDAAAGGRAVMLRDDTKHNRWASPAALRAAGIDSATADPAGGEIRRALDGTPTGVLIEAAGTLVEHALAAAQPITDKMLAAASRRGIEILHTYGVTAFQDAAASAALLRGLKSLDDRGELAAWVVTSMLANDFIFGVSPLGEGIISERAAAASQHHRPTFIKIFLDGVPPSRTAAFTQPYLPDPHGCTHCGEPTMSQDELDGWLLSTAKRGIGAKIHCTGDASVHMVLDAVGRVRAAGFTDVLYHVAHGQFVLPEDIPRFRELGVVAEISPALWFPGVIAAANESVLPDGRGERMQPNRALLDAGATVIGGSDWPVAVSPDIWGAIYGLVTRRDPTGEFPGELWAEQAITLDEAIRAYTVDSARALGIDDVTGSLAVGKSADFVVLSADPHAVDIEQVPQIHARQTWFAGEPVFTAP